MKKIVIIGANEFQKPLILKARELGYETHVFAWKEGAVGEEVADYFYPISIVDKEKIYEECLRIKPDAVVSIASDLAVITVNFLAEHLGLVGNSQGSTEITTNKYKMRQRLLERGIPTPKFIKVHGKDEMQGVENLSLPTIVKPTDRSGSRGITKINDYLEYESAIVSAVEESFEHAAIIEEYIMGEEYSCECISYRGEHTLLAITKKYTTGAPHFIEKGHIEPSGLCDEVKGEVERTVFAALDALEIENGASHSEVKIDKNGQVKIVEIGARMGGDCIGSDLVQLSTGYDFVKMVIDVAASKEPDFAVGDHYDYAGVKFIFNDEDYETMQKFEEENAGRVVRKSNIIKVDCVSDSSTRWGFYVLVENEWKGLERILNY